MEPPASLDFDAFDVLTFDCYGTLIDWEAGILAGLRPVLERAAPARDDEASLEAYGRAEADIEAGPYRRYRDVLGEALRRLAADAGVEPTEAELAAFGGSVADWPAFPDSAAALARLATRFRLAVITNCDDDLFAASNRRLGVRFDPIVTAEQVQSYKPDERNFLAMFERLGVLGIGPAAGAVDRLGRPPARPNGIGRDAAGRGRAEPDRAGPRDVRSTGGAVARLRQPPTPTPPAARTSDGSSVRRNVVTDARTSGSTESTVSPGACARRFASATGASVVRARLGIPRIAKTAWSLSYHRSPSRNPTWRPTAARTSPSRAGGAASAATRVP
jgi:2-haloacid dehalogenase